MRLIDADELITQIESYIKRKAITEKDAKIFELICGLIDNAPTVEPIKQCKYCKHCGNEDYCSNCHSDHSLFEYYERPQGEWIKIGDIGLAYTCNKCGEVNVIQTNFCPNCGADTRKGGAECMKEDAKQASIPYTYNAPQHDWKCGYPDSTGGK